MAVTGKAGKTKSKRYIKDIPFVLVFFCTEMYKKNG